MKIPKYWAKATLQETDVDGHKITFSCWRWADDSQTQAEQAARAAATRAIANLLGGVRLDRYEYGQCPLREQVLNQVCGADGNPMIAVTRNRYGAIVLNAARAAFIDLDFPPISAVGQVSRLFAWLLGKPKVSFQTQHESEIRNQIEQFIASRPKLGFRIYRTYAGMRALATSGLFNPTASETIEMLKQLNADPLYIRLCRGQGCFRARLSPKPWRCSCQPNRVAWPWEDEDARVRFERWEANYAASQKRYATCRFVAAVGNPQIHPELSSMIQLHDQATRCHENLPLA
ncbi:MAG: hypothetical protein EA424_08260 [Planctomycetaceae bacterium]|nr:MAG: hypothetical protein EA424_08260 [Planctomycetaceae bacterium]